MESKVIEQKPYSEYSDVEIYDFGADDGDIRIQDQYDGECVIIKREHIPDLIAALQSFLPKETE